MKEDRELLDQLLFLYVQLYSTGSCSNPVYIYCNNCILYDERYGCYRSRYLMNFLEFLEILGELYIHLDGTFQEIKEAMVEYLL